MNQAVEKIISDNNESYLQMCIQLLCTPEIEKTVLDAITVEEGTEYTGAEGYIFTIRNH